MECMTTHKWSKGLATAAIVYLLFAATGKSEQIEPDAEIGTSEECSAEVGSNVFKGTLETISHKASLIALPVVQFTKMGIVLAKVLNADCAADDLPKDLGE